MPVAANYHFGIKQGYFHLFCGFQKISLGWSSKNTVYYHHFHEKNKSISQPNKRKEQIPLPSSYQNKTGDNSKQCYYYPTHWYCFLIICEAILVPDLGQNGGQLVKKTYVCFKLTPTTLQVNHLLVKVGTKMLLRDGNRTGHQHRLEISWQIVKGGHTWEKQNLCHRLYQKVGNYFQVVKNQKRSFFP